MGEKGRAFVPVCLMFFPFQGKLQCLCSVM